jgi:signal transduction histidine kinase/pSer/pThr/pTyr-binding forkhead associated (FHA) protein
MEDNHSEQKTKAFYGGFICYENRRRILNKVYVINGPDKGKPFNLNDDITTIGRSPDNDIRISDKGISRHHGKFLKKDDKIFIVDLNSSHGLFIDGEKIEPGREVEIKKENNLRMGSTLLSFQKESQGRKRAKSLPKKVEREPFDNSKPSKHRSRTYIRSLELLLSVSNILAQSLSIEEVFGEVLDRIFDFLKRIDRGAILSLDTETGTLKEMASKQRMEEKEGLLSKINYSRTIVKRTIEEGKPVMMVDTSRVDKAELSDSMKKMNIRSVMCVPLKYKEEVRGAIYVDSLGLHKGFRKDDLQLLTRLSNTAAIAIENARLYSDLEKLVKRRTKQLENAQDRLIDSESRFRAVFEHMSNGVAIFEAIDEDEDFILKDLNKAAEKIDNVKREDVIGKSVLTVYPGFKDSGLFDICKRVWKTGRPEDHAPMLYKDDKITSWRTIYGYRLPSGEIVLIYEDVTAQKEMTENQVRLQQQLFHAQKMQSLGRLAGGVAHNFRNILQAILGNTQFLQMAYRGDEQLGKITMLINESVKKGSDFIDSLLTFSRPVIEKEMLPIDLKDVIDEIYNIIRNTFDKKIKILKKVEEPLPVKGDFLNLNQVFMNLCNNARDSMANGGELTIEAKKLNKKVMVTISDTGCGMDEEVLKNAFDPFYTTKEVGEGTGLGLSIAHRIVDEHNGDISISSQPGKGSVFKVSFPKAEEFDQIGSESPLKINLGEGEKILIVDDELAVLEALENMLKAIGYEVDVVSNGIHAIEHYRSFKPDLILMDWKMPDMDGVACAKKILEIDPAARIVMISGYKETEIDKIDNDLKNALKGFVLKPFDIKALSKIIFKVLK